MPVTDITTDPEALTLTIAAEFDAPLERVWATFTDPRQLERFWGPPGWPATFTQFDFAPGGLAQYAMTGPRGESSRGRWEFVRIDEPDSFEVLDGFADENGDLMAGMPAMRMVFSFTADGDRTRFDGVTHFASHEALEQSVGMGMVQGIRLAMGQLDIVLQDLRAYAQGKGTRTEILGDQHVRITRLIDGPRELVWRAHHEPELLKTWLLGPDGWQLVECEVGETYRYVWQQGDDEATRFGFEGETLLSEPVHRSVTTEKMIGTDGPSALNDLQLYEEDGVTLLTLVIEYPDAETRDMILATGMTDGMEASYARLEEAIRAS